MNNPNVLARIAVMHVTLVAALASALALGGGPVRGVLLGGGAMVLSMGLLVAIARAAASMQQLLVAMLASLKVLIYLGLATAVVSGWVVADGGGFAAGVTCFVLATVGAIWLQPASGETA